MKILITLEYKDLRSLFRILLCIVNPQSKQTTFVRVHHSDMKVVPQDKYDVHDNLTKSNDSSIG
jgi:hypothetical protein